MLNIWELLHFTRNLFNNRTLTTYQKKLLLKAFTNHELNRTKGSIDSFSPLTGPINDQCLTHMEAIDLFEMK